MAVRVLLVVGSVLFGLLLLELGCRLARGPATLLDWKNIVLDERSKQARYNKSFHLSYDPLLGYSQRAGFASVRMNVGSNGFRAMPELPKGATESGPVLATGDSYTEGTEVGDSETWPAVLQTLLRHWTINAGVSGYGIDQTVLLNEQLATTLRPSLLVVGFISDDLRRAEMSRTWGSEKPYFTLNGEALVLHNVPVPPSPELADTLDFWQRALGWSVLVDTVLEQRGLRYEWLLDDRRATPPGTGERLACPLMRRLAGLGVPTLVVAQYDFYGWQNSEYEREERRLSRVVLGCAEAAGLATLDLYEQTVRAVRTEGEKAIYGAFHPSPRGYSLIAHEIAAELDRRKMLPQE